MRERKGSFFTPRKWVELSQHYLELELGENWQDEYYVWDCCAGTGNLFVGLTNKHRVWASTLDMQDVAVMKQCIANGANLLDAHVFQFDFLNDPLDSEKIPEDLHDVLSDAEKRKRLVIYINPPYAEAGDAKQKTGTGKNKSGVSFHSVVYHQAKPVLKTGARELFALFLFRVFKEMPGCIVGQFSKLKHVQAPNFAQFREFFHAELLKCFMVPADTFDNVKGKFPIGFFVWRLGSGIFTSAVADTYDAKGCFDNTQYISSYANDHNVIEWLRHYYDKCGERIAYLRMNGTNVQNNVGIYLASTLSQNDFHNHFYAEVTMWNVGEMCVYLAIRTAIEATWKNDREQYLVPNEAYETDVGFKMDCLVFTLFHGQNRIKSADGVNHWIPFTEKEVNAQGLFKSHFMSDFLAGKIDVKGTEQGDLFADASATERKPLVFSAEAKAVMDAGRELWRYYHAQPNANPNASFYDIRLHFQGSTKDAKGKERMNNESSDAKYTELLVNLRAAMKQLARHIEPKVYEYGFLKR